MGEDTLLSPFLVLNHVVGGCVDPGKRTPKRLVIFKRLVHPIIQINFCFDLLLQTVNLVLNLVLYYIIVGSIVLFLLHCIVYLSQNGVPNLLPLVKFILLVLGHVPHKFVLQPVHCHFSRLFFLGFQALEFFNCCQRAEIRQILPMIILRQNSRNPDLIMKLSVAILLRDDLYLRLALPRSFHLRPQDLLSMLQFRTTDCLVWIRKSSVSVTCLEPVDTAEATTSTTICSTRVVTFERDEPVYWLHFLGFKVLLDDVLVLFAEFFLA